jgi:ABC-type nitrate/sulfonate/bicarbonate transport system substrate-binding protein
MRIARMKYLAFFALIVLFSCKSNKMIVDVIEVTRESGKRDTIINTYWNNFYMDDYKMEWLLKKNGIDPKEVVDINLLEKRVKRYSNKELSGS